MNPKSNAISMHLAHRIDRAPLLIESSYVPALEALIEKADAFYELGQEEIQARYDKTKAMMLQAYGIQPEASFSDDDDDHHRKPYAYGAGTAVIPIHGTLVNRCNDTACGTMTGYNMIQSALSAAIADDDVQRILFDVDSGGGEVSGCAETAKAISDAGKVKPTMAFVDSSCYSAAYWLASAANKVVALGSGGVGSIGALMVHTEYSKALSEEGIKVTIIRAGEKKAAGNPYEPLSDDFIKDMQAGVNKARLDFATAVAEYRGLDLSAVLGTEAAVFSAKDAMGLGLVDELSDPMHAMALFGDDVRGADKKKGSSTTKAEHQLNETEGDAMTEQEISALRAEAAEAERTRISAIIASDEAKGREGLANHFAFKTNLDPEAAVAAMMASPKTEAKSEDKEPERKEPEQTASKAFAESMAGTGNPNVGAGDGVGDSALAPTTSATNADDDMAKQIIASARAAGVIPSVS